MAEDPGVGTLSAIIDAIRQAFGFVQDVGKSILNTAADITRTYMYMSWRRNARGGQSFKHGEQSLKHLRAQEAAGAKIVTVEIGKDEDSMRALEWELRKLDVDFAITRSGSGEWLLHYKQSNEQDILRAQTYAFNSQYENPNHSNSVRRDPLQQDSAWVDLDPQSALRSGRNETAQADRDTQSFNQTKTQESQEQETQQSSNVSKAVAPTAAYTKAESTLHNQEQTKQSVSVDERKTERITDRSNLTQSATLDQTKDARANTVTRNDRTTPALSTYESLDSLKSKARIQAAQKNQNRDKNKNRSRNRNLERKARTRTRAYELTR